MKRQTMLFGVCYLFGAATGAIAFGGHHVADASKMVEPTRAPTLQRLDAIEARLDALEAAPTSTVESPTGRVR